MPIELLMPALSPTMTEGKLAKWLKKEGDQIHSGDLIAEIETDKATMEMEAVDEGTLGKILVQEGTEGIAVNKAIGILLEEGESDADLKKVKPAAAETTASAPVKKQSAESAKKPLIPEPVAQSAPEVPLSILKGNRIFASPLAKRIAADAGVDLAGVAGSGPNQRVVKADVESAIAQGGARTLATPGARPAAPSGPAPDFGQPYTEVPNSGMRKTIARRLVEAKSTIPHFYLTIDCRIDELLAVRKGINGNGEDGYKVSVNDFIIKASALALRKVPYANAMWTEEAVRLYENVDISVAVSTPEGLITPIVRGADKKTLGVISSEVKDLAGRARDKKLKPEEFQGGGFSISNLGMFGIREFSAVINPPQVCILAVGKGDQRPVVVDGAVVIANIMTCTLSCDHRVVDGAVGAEFLQAFQSYLENPLRMLV
jgi:pyruvate dehydrogenase E2 component (dihydrolipoamide acetyltransferase)